MAMFVSVRAIVRVSVIVVVVFVRVNGAVVVLMLVISLVHMRCRLFVYMRMRVKVAGVARCTISHMCLFASIIIIDLPFVAHRTCASTNLAHLVLVAVQSRACPSDTSV